MQAKELQSIYRAQPFQPFVMHLGDGRSILVAHPEFMAISTTGRSAVVYEKGGWFEIVDVMLVTSCRATNSRGRRQSER
ncbi:MAG: hypothetical protein PVI86_04075 [Phycisphaerae bacterium]|jgi:hypothetical protein